MDPTNSAFAQGLNIVSSSDLEHSSPFWLTLTHLYVSVKMSLQPWEGSPNRLPQSHPKVNMAIPLPYCSSSGHSTQHTAMTTALRSYTWSSGRSGTTSVYPPEPSTVAGTYHVTCMSYKQVPLCLPMNEDHSQSCPPHPRSLHLTGGLSDPRHGGHGSHLVAFVHTGLSGWNAPSSPPPLVT